MIATLLVGAKWVVGSLDDGAHLHIVLGLSGSRARLISLTAGVSLQPVRDSLFRDDFFAIGYGASLLIASIGKDGLQIRRLQKLYVHVRVLAVMTTVADLAENTLLRIALRMHVNSNDGTVALTYSSDLAGEFVRAASILKFTCFVGALVATVVRLGSTVLPQSKSELIGQGAAPPHSAERSPAPTFAVARATDDDDATDGRSTRSTREEIADDRNETALRKRQTPLVATRDSKRFDEPLGKLVTKVKNKMASRWDGRD